MRFVTYLLAGSSLVAGTLLESINAYNQHDTLYLACDRRGYRNRLLSAVFIMEK